MLNRPEGQRGFTLVELIVTVLIVAIVLGIAAPNIGIWVQNAKIRTTADAILNGLQMARAEGVKRNTPVHFQLTDSLTNACVLSTASSNWIISLLDPTGKCGAAPADPPPNTAAVAGNAGDPFIVQSRTSAEGSAGVTVAADQSAFIFTGLGRLTPVPAAALNINISNPAAGNCVAAGGVVKCMRITVSTGGQLRMCNPALSIATNPQGC